jgi:hypothetical protein
MPHHRIGSDDITCLMVGRAFPVDRSNGMVTIVPEPGTMTLLLISTAFLMLGEWFHKRF